MKVIHINTHLNVGGIGQYIVSLTKALKERGVQCIVASAGGDLEPELRENGITHMYLDIKTKFFLSPKILIASFALSKIIRDEHIDLIHAHTRVSQVVADLASRMTGIPYVSTCHGYFKPRLSRRLFDSWGKRIVAISGAVKAHLERDFGINEKRIALIFNGIDFNRFSKTYSSEEISRSKSSLGLKRGPVIGTMGRLSPVKGQRFLIEAMKYVIMEKNDAQCLIVGGGKEGEKLKNFAASLNISENIKFTGSAYADTPRLISLMDIFALPSLKEGLGLALLEAMSAGKPCIGSDIGGISEIIKDGVSGISVPVGDAKALGNAILKLLNDSALREAMAQKGKEFIKEKFTLDLMADQMAKLYEEVISEQ